MTEGMIRDLEAEQTVIMSALLYPEKMGEADLSAEDFGLPEHRRLWALMAELDADGTPLDAVIVRRACVDRDWRREAQIVLEMTDFAPDAPRFVHYAKRVKDRAQRRRLIDAANRITELANDGEQDIQATTSKAMDFLSGVAGRSLAERERTIAQLYASKMRLIDAGKRREAFITGYSDLWPNGMGRGVLNVIGARPSMGKTAFALNLAGNLLSFNPELRLLIVSQEMTFSMLEDRIFSMVTGSSMDRTADPTILPSAAESRKWAEGRALTAEWGDRAIILQDRVSPSFLRSRVRALKRARGLDVVIVDYLQLMAGGKGENRRVQVSNLSAQILDMGINEGVTPVVLSQLNREAESREPSMADLKESGDIEQDARNIFLLDRPFVRGGDLHTGGRAEECDLVVKVAKFSEGRAFGRLRLHYELESQRIEGYPGNLPCRRCGIGEEWQRRFA